MIHLFVKHLLLIFFYVFSTNLYADSNNQFSVATAHEIATRTGLEILKKGSEKARIRAEENLKNIREKVGLI